MKENKKKYLDAELEVNELQATDVIATSNELGDGKDVDDGGWTSLNSWG